MLASTMPGRPKMILNPKSFSTKPNAPADPHSTINATPTMTGETANGRSMTACSTPLPRNLLRASTNAVGIPKNTFSGTTMATTSSDRFSADIAAGVLIPVVELAEARVEGPPQDHATGTISRHQDVGQRHIPGEVANPAATMSCALSSRLAARAPTTRKSEQHDERDRQQHNGYRGGPGAVVVLDQRADPLRRHSVLPGTAPPISTTEPNSPMPAKTPGPHRTATPAATTAARPR